MHAVPSCCVLLWFVRGQFCTYPSTVTSLGTGHMIAPVPVKHPWRLWVNIRHVNHWKLNAHSRLSRNIQNFITTTKLNCVQVWCEILYYIVWWLSASNWKFVSVKEVQRAMDTESAKGKVTVMTRWMLFYIHPTLVQFIDNMSSLVDMASSSYHDS